MNEILLQYYLYFRDSALSPFVKKRFALHLKKKVVTILNLNNILWTVFIIMSRQKNTWHQKLGSV